MELLDNQLHNSFDNIESIFWDPIPHELMINTYKEVSFAYFVNFGSSMLTKIRCFKIPKTSTVV